MEKNKTIYMGDLPDNWEGLGNPKNITFSVTEDCNLACKYCYMTGKNHTKRMSFETAKKAVDYFLANRDIFDNKSVIWEFIGGEPFLEIDLIDKLTDYIKQQMFLLDHPWFNSYRLSFSTNGLLYNTPKVQHYIKKNLKHLSIGISIDGNKIKHDLQRVKPDGSGSYDEVIKNVPLWLKQLPGGSTKATFAHADIPYLKDSIISLWNLGIKSVAANVVFEDVWEDGDDLILEQQLKELADYVLENRLWEEYTVRFFDPHIGNPLSEDEKKQNYCGAGKMLAVDTEGNFTPCVRFLGVSLSNRPPIIIGNADTGIDNDKLRPFLSLDLTSQSLPECVTCEVASGCAWCQGCNYDLADTSTIYQRATYLCKMHKATVRANKYFWDKFEKVTGLVSKRKTEGEERYMQFITSDQIEPHCSYRNERGTKEVMSPEVFKKGIAFCKKQNITPVLLGIPEGLVNSSYKDYLKIDRAGMNGNDIAVYDNQVDAKDSCFIANLILSRKNIENFYTMAKKLLDEDKRINLIVDDLHNWKQGDLDNYQIQLEKISDYVYQLFLEGKEPEINGLTDLWNLESMNNCDAGVTTFALAPNGKIYACPGFYFDNPDNFIGSLETGFDIKNAQLYNLKNAPICSKCDVYSCDRCKLQNLKTTGEINTPSKNQCLLNHIQRNMSMNLQTKLKENGYDSFTHVIQPIDYLDPFDLIKQ